MRYELPSGRPLWSAPSTLRCESGAWIAADLDVVLCGEAGGRVVGVDLATGTVVSDRFDTQRGNVHLLSSDGTTLLGLANEDSYTVQLIDDQEKLVSLTKADLREFTILTVSPMPSYRDRLTQDGIADVVAYLLSLKGR